MIFRNSIQRIISCRTLNQNYGMRTECGSYVNRWRGMFQNTRECYYPNNQRHESQLIRKKSTISGEKPFKILGLQQIAVGSTDANAMTNLWVDVFGLTKIGSYTSETENVSEDILKLGSDNKNSVSVEVDLMCPLDEEKSPKVHNPPLNHIGLWVDDLENAVEWMASHGVRFTPGGIRKGAAGHDVTFIHPKGNDSSPIGGGGVLIELVQAPDDVIAKLK